MVDNSHYYCLTRASINKSNQKLVANNGDDVNLELTEKISADSDSRIKSQITVETVSSSTHFELLPLTMIQKCILICDS